MPEKQTSHPEPSLEQNQISPSLSDVSVFLLLPSSSYITKTVLKFLFFSLSCRDLWRLGRTAWRLKLLLLNHRVRNPILTDNCLILFTSLPVFSSYTFDFLIFAVRLLAH
jgi:hypothetical protein